MYLSYVYLLVMHTLICVTFSLPPGVGGWLQLLLVAFPFTFFFYIGFRRNVKADKGHDIKTLQCSQVSLSISHISILGTFHVDKDETIRLHYNATDAATPPDAVDRFKDGIKIHSDSKRPILITKQFTISKMTITCELLIFHVDLSDTAIYSCRTSDLVSIGNGAQQTEHTQARICTD